MSILNGLSSFGGKVSDLGNEAAQDTLTAPLRRPLMSTPAPEVAKPMGDMGKPLDSSVVGRAHQVYQGLVARGMDPITAVGFAANAVQESGANPNVGAGDSGASHGLMQWRGDRLTNYVSMFGHTPEKGTLDEQLNYLVHEISGPQASAWKAIQAAPQDAAARAAAISQYFERPADTRGEIQRRSLIANQLAAHFADIAARQGG